MRKLLLVPLLGLIMATPAEARKVAAQPSPVVRAIRSDTVVVGKVTAIEKDPLEVAAPGDTAKQSYRVAVIKADAVLSGAPDLTHVKVGFIPPPPVDPTKPAPPRRGYPPVVLTEGQTGVFFLLKHPSAAIFVISPMMPPIDATAADYKTELESIKRAMTVLADPTKHLKVEKAEDRFFAAAVLIMKYRSYPENASDVEQVKVSAEESRLILKGLADAPDWSRPTGFPISATQLMNYLALTDKDGWKNPMLRPGVPEDVNRLFKDAFIAWLDGAGKDYRITKMVAKK
jgi:hypothetical protein